MSVFQSILAALAFVPFALTPLPAMAQASEPLQIVAFGDSLTAGYGLAPGDAFPEQLEASLRADGYNVEVINAGVSGDTTSGGLARLDWSVPDTADLVIVELGANDALRGVAPEIVEENLDRILTKLGNRDTSVLLAGMLAPPNMGAAYAAKFNPIYERLAEKHDVALYPFFLEGVAAVPELNLDDGIHPTAEGIAMIVESIKPYVVRQIEAIRSSASG